MYKELDIENWNRKNHFYFFKDYDNPFYNICTNIEVTELYNITKANNVSFFLASLYLSIKTANEIDEFRYRIIDDKVVVFDKIHPFSTILDKENIFHFCPFNYFEEFDKFISNGKVSIENTLNMPSILESNPERLDVIHYTTIPWVSLTSMSHAKKFNNGDSIPNIVFGKYYYSGNSLMLPICVEVHHSLIDGYHVGKYFEKLRRHIINSQNIIL